jgi:hypothetical protein
MPYDNVMDLSNFEDEPIIGTERFEPFQEMVSRAGEFAIYKAKKAGLPITGLDKNRRIVKSYPDGHEEILGQLPPAFKPTKFVYDMAELAPLPSITGKDNHGDAC